MGEEQECDQGEGGGPSPKWILGLVCCVIGSTCNAFGFVLGKMAHSANEDLVQRGKRPWPSLGGLLLSPLWMLGFAINAILGTPFEMIALGTLPSSVNAPMSGVTVIMGQVLAPWILKEPITRSDWAASLLITVGVAMTAVFGSHCSAMFSVEDIIKLWGSPLFHAFEVSAALLLLLALLSIRCLIPRLTKDHKNVKPRKAICYSLLAGLVGGQSNLLVKAVSEFAERLFSGEPSDWRTSPVPYVFVIGALMGASCQLSYVNLGIKNWTMVKTFPIYTSSLIVCQAIYGGVFYQDYKHMTVAGFIGFPIALVIQICGIAMLCLRDSRDLLDINNVSMDPCCHDDMAEAAQSQQQRTPFKCETASVSLPHPNEVIVDTDSKDPTLRSAGREEAPPVTHESMVGAQQAEHIQ